jgi:hypothetical protein
MSELMLRYEITPEHRVRSSPNRFPATSRRIHWAWQRYAGLRWGQGCYLQRAARANACQPLDGNRHDNSRREWLWDLQGFSHFFVQFLPLDATYQ